MHLAAHTASTGQMYPEYLSIRMTPAGKVSITVRSPAKDGWEGSCAQMELSAEDFTEAALGAVEIIAKKAIGELQCST